MNLRKIKNSRVSQLVFQLVADTLAIWISFALQLYFRFFSGTIETVILPTLFDYALGSIMMAIFWYLIFFLTGMYQNWYLRSPFDEFFALVRSSFIGCFIIAVLVLSNSVSSFRFLFLIYFVITTFLFVFFRFIGRRLQIYLRKKRIIKIPIIIIGDPTSSVEFYLEVQKSLSWGFEVKGFISIDKISDEAKKEFIDKNTNVDLYLGDVEDFSSIIEACPVEEIVFSTNKDDSDLLFSLATVCTEKGIRVNIEPHLYDHFKGQTRTQSMYSIPLIEISTQLLKPWELVIKRFYDIIFSFLVLFSGSPLWILVAIFIKLDSKGKVFYTQPRVGRDNKIFVIYKFRSMTQTKCSNSEEQKWTKVGDPRVTRFGKVLRKTHIDEIPQFWNVLKGDMSIVGPRPEQPKFVTEFAEALPYYNRRHIIRPGITGWGQVNTKNYQLTLEEVKKRVKHDFYYIENISLRLDLEIVIRTVWCVVTGSGQA